MDEEVIFSGGEGDNWFIRNKKVLVKNHKDDWPIRMLQELNMEFDSVLEVGCSNGWRLECLRSKYYPKQRFVGVDISAKAIEEGKNIFSQIELYQGSLCELPVQETFDVVFCQMVLHWIERDHLFRAISEIDRVTKSGGVVILGDFYPDFNQKKRYHHLADQEVFTYKQDYAKIFVASGVYKEIYAASCAMEESNEAIVRLCNANARVKCTILQKQKYDEFYPEVK